METVTSIEQSILPRTIGAYLIQRLHEHGVHYVFGVPGDYVLGFDKLLEDSPIQFINT